METRALGPLTDMAVAGALFGLGYPSENLNIFRTH